MRKDYRVREREREKGGGGFEREGGCQRKRTLMYGSLICHVIKMQIMEEIKTRV